ncbi:MAG: hypothetical protein ACRECG_12590, partial [Bradyrhizobium sp.]
AMDCFASLAMTAGIHKHRHSGARLFLGANLRCAIAHRGIHPTAIVAAQWIPGSRKGGAPE